MSWLSLGLCIASGGGVVAYYNYEKERRLTGADGRAVPQDIEGCVTADGQVWIVQARPQP